jgi:ATP-dependent Clp protease protease subunit
MAELIAEHTGQSVQQVQADSERDRWFTAQQALEYGFVDRVVAGVAQMPNGSGPAPA